MAGTRLKDLYRDLEPSGEEIGNYRANLSRKLSMGEAREKRTFLDRLAGFNGFRPAVPVLMIAGFAIFVIVSVTLRGPAVGPGYNLQELQEIAEATEDKQKLMDDTLLVAGREQGFARFNALMLISMLGTDDVNIMAAADGLLVDPRADFREYYLEYLLDYADEAYFNIPLIEEKMEEEDDEICFLLYEELLHLAISRT